MKSVYLIITLVFALNLSTHACRCIGRVGIDKKSDVLIGTVSKVNEKKQWIVVTIEIDTIFKGKEQINRNVKIKTRKYGPSCGFSFLLGKTYAVYGDRKLGKIYVSRCSQTEAVATSQLEGYKPKESQGIPIYDRNE